MSYFYFENSRIYYNVIGKGEPVLLLHGNTASSKMFDSFSEQIAKDFTVVLIDFPGHGKSERVKNFKSDFWFYNAEACNALIDELKIDKVSVVGTSGGALVGINLALEHPEKVKFLIADSFMGEFIPREMLETLIGEREKSKRNKFAKEFWEFNHGSDWEKVVDQDTEMLIGFVKSGKSFFHKSISELSVPTLLTGSKEDEYFVGLENIYANLKRKNNRLEIDLFENGSHPAMLSNPDIFCNRMKEKTGKPGFTEKI